MKEMKESDESNRTFTTLLASLTLHDFNSTKQKAKPDVETEFIYRLTLNCKWVVANSNDFVFTPKIDFLGDMTPSISQKTFPPLLMRSTNNYVVDIFASIVNAIDDGLSALEQ